MSDVTQINPVLHQETVLNPALSSAAETVLNPQLSPAETSGIPAGTILLEKYEVLEKMSVSSSGEADIYLCQADGIKYAAKLYRRETAVKTEVLHALMKINSRYVAKVYDFGTFQGRQIEMMQYFPNGSLLGRTFSFKELGNRIIPCINHGLKALHHGGIIHKDLKPSNIMLCDDGKNVAIIDFGISSLENDGNTVIVTRTGMTPEYSAPESHHGLFLEESDYYSFGILIYELFTGTTPYRNLSAEQIAQYSAVQKIPFPENMPQKLQNLIAGLTYHDITNRNEKNNPNRRWTFEEVRSWCKGNEPSVPGQNVSVPSFPAYRFLKKDYHTIPELTEALAMHWTEGKKQLFRGLLSGFFKNYLPETAGIFLDAEDSEADEDTAFFRMLYQLRPDTAAFFWRGERWENLQILGKNLLYDLRTEQDIGYYQSILHRRTLTEYFQLTMPENQTAKEMAAGLEKTYALHPEQEHHVLVCLYSMGYALSGEHTLLIQNHEFSVVTELTAFLSSLLNQSETAMEKFCHLLIQEDCQLNPQLESWLLWQGKRKELETWKRKL